MSIPPPALEVIASSVAFGRGLASRIDRELAGQGLTWGQFHILVTLERHGGWMHAASLARRVGISRQAAHGLMSRLDDRGFLRWKHDGHIRSALLTQDGNDAVGQAWKAIEHVVRAIERTTVEERIGLLAAQRSIEGEMRRRPWTKPFYFDSLPDEIKAAYQSR
jgi:DNA-binding MarR family transcriptional regulator